MQKILVIIGPTASGKSELAVRLAKKFGGEIISADSRQVYKWLDVGTGKITKEEMQGIPHHLLDVSEPKEQFTVSEFIERANQAIAMIYHNGHIPILAGGTGFYIDALAGKISLNKVPVNEKLRRKLKELSPDKLFEILKDKDPRRARNIDRNNKVRLIRALEIVEALGSVPPIQKQASDKKFVYIGLKPINLNEKIYKRLIVRLSGMIKEAEILIEKRKITYRRMDELGLEYRYLAKYLQGKISKEEMINQLYKAIKLYAKRQMTWFRRNKDIKWFTLSGVEGFTPNEYQKMEDYVKLSLGKEALDGGERPEKWRQSHRLGR